MESLYVLFPSGEKMEIIPLSVFDYEKSTNNIEFLEKKCAIDKQNHRVKYMEVWEQVTPHIISRNNTKEYFECTKLLVPATSQLNEKGEICIDGRWIPACVMYPEEYFVRGTSVGVKVDGEFHVLSDVLSKALLKSTQIVRHEHIPETTETVRAPVRREPNQERKLGLASVLASEALKFTMARSLRPAGSRFEDVE